MLRATQRAPYAQQAISKCFARSFATKYDRPVGGSSDFQVPDFKDDLNPAKNGSSTKRNLSYFMIGSFGLATAISARHAVQDFLTTMSASKDVLAMAKVEVDLANVPTGKNLVVKWRGKPVFVRHRSDAEIKEANSVDISTLRDPQTDSERVKDPHWLVMIGICTHLGCVPIGDSGDYDGWYCPCHGSHYDISGRIRKGPAPTNLEIPEYTLDGTTLTVG
ncbi:ubiquinol--cytochrome-c reductase catalytic subunit [Starmerella bacillaris]|uniref:Cytochrome b-c1 complex subunit Rieske, mitochondrial n=1 Tax=Starmerella bacillaris TaxID=1247836 RepID=A0AAV5RME5_STABA|nr:ubiquinol--cytochrome-c reductase catalytic subunit [Starmerella bacillaris]